MAPLGREIQSRKGGARKPVRLPRGTESLSGGMATLGAEIRSRKDGDWKQQA